jgi:hypothetical protein
MMALFRSYQLEWRPSTQLPVGFYIIRLQTPDQQSQHMVQLVGQNRHLMTGSQCNGF